MSMIGEIASLSTAMSTARLQTAVATRVFKLAAQQQGQVAAKLLESAMENAEMIVTRLAEDAGGNIDTFA